MFIGLTIGVLLWYESEAEQDDEQWISPPHSIQLMMTEAGSYFVKCKIEEGKAHWFVNGEEVIED